MITCRSIIQWNLLIGTLENVDTCIILTRLVGPKVSIMHRFHCMYYYIIIRIIYISNLHCYIYVHVYNIYISLYINPDDMCLRIYVVKIYCVLYRIKISCRKQLQAQSHKHNMHSYIQL